MSEPANATRPAYGKGRDALLMAAIEVVAARGLRGLTIRSVAEQAGVSHGLIRFHFGSRDGLVEATLIRSVELAIDTTSLEPGTGAIDDMAADLGDWAESETELTAFQYECLLEARRQPHLLPYAREMYDNFIEAAQRELDRAGLGDDPDLARAVFAALDGLVLQQTVFGGCERTKRSVAAVHEMVHAVRDARAAKPAGKPARKPRKR
ncbi:MAG TPA: TetR family transcriptional regulator [Solirubrobacteraceae bacterium]|nr:TetR family transcriptional regulator [Solirubrobacteraceae bacterium]